MTDEQPTCGGSVGDDVTRRGLLALGATAVTALSGCLGGGGGGGGNNGDQTTTPTTTPDRQVVATKQSTTKTPNVSTTPSETTKATNGRRESEPEALYATLAGRIHSEVKWLTEDYPTIAPQLGQWDSAIRQYLATFNNQPRRVAESDVDGFEQAVEEHQQLVKSILPRYVGVDPPMESLANSRQRVYGELRAAVGADDAEGVRTAVGEFRQRLIVGPQTGSNDRVGGFNPWGFNFTYGGVRPRTAWSIVYPFLVRGEVTQNGQFQRLTGVHRGDQTILDPTESDRTDAFATGHFHSNSITAEDVVYYRFHGSREDISVPPTTTTTRRGQDSPPALRMNAMYVCRDRDAAREQEASFLEDSGTGTQYDLAEGVTIKQAAWRSGGEATYGWLVQVGSYIVLCNVSHERTAAWDDTVQQWVFA